MSVERYSEHRGGQPDTMPEPVITVARESQGRTLQDVLSAHAGISRRKAKELIDSRLVFVNRRRVWMARHTLRTGDRVEWTGGAGAAKVPPALLRVIVEDPDFLVVAKPAGMLSDGEGSAEEILRQSRGEPTIRMVHRLDRDTTGCLIAARNDRAFDAFVEAFKAKLVVKVYRVVVLGRFGVAQRTIRAAIDGEESVTHLRMLHAGDRASYLSARIDTGRTHQIRRHLADSGFPVLGDRQYGSMKFDDPRLMKVPRQMLHAFSLEFPHPTGGRRIRAEAPLPRDFQTCLRVFGLT